MEEDHGCEDLDRNHIVAEEALITTKAVVLLARPFLVALTIIVVLSSYLSFIFN